MLFEAIVTLLAITRTTNSAARITGVRTFLPALAPKRLALLAGMDEEIIARQMDRCTSFNNDPWVQYWTEIAFDHIDELDHELGKARLPPIKGYVRGDRGTKALPPEVYAHVRGGAMLLQRCPLGAVTNVTEFIEAAPNGQHGPIIAMDAALKATAYLFQASWPGRTPKRKEGVFHVHASL